MKQILIFYVLLVLGQCEHKTYRYVKIEGNVRIPQDIDYDVDANTVTIVVGDVPEYKNKLSTVNLHDFDTGYVVFKDIRRQFCLLSKSPIPVPMPLLYRLGESNLTLPYDASIIQDVLTHEKVTEIAGSRIASFCNDYRTYYMNLTKLKPNSHQSRKIHPEEFGSCSAFCIGCVLKFPKSDIDALSGIQLIG